jgi:DNA-binding winged helix-turn-helix (wHTH) protein/tetratricopeptide (TPR) repeat protein
VSYDAARSRLQRRELKLIARSVTARAYRFADYRLDPAARELRRDGELLPLPRRVFDGLAYLVEHRDRAVGHDELIAALWGRVDVANTQVSQLVMHVRRAVGDDSAAQRVVRTVSGFGYRWIVATEEIAPANGGNGSTSDDPKVAIAPSTPPMRSEHAAARAGFRRRIALISAIALCLAAAFFQFGISHRQRSADALPDSHTTVVLPIEVTATEDTDATWIRLGAMDLVASRLREAGLAVPPSDSVVAALHAGLALPEDQRQSALERALGSDLLVQGTAERANGGWKVELRAMTGAAVQQRVEVERPEVIDAARQAADLLLAALGRSRPDGGNADEALSERLQRARAAMLSGEVAMARSILGAAPPAMQDDPELRYELARLDFHSGRNDEAHAIIEKLLADPALASVPGLRSRTLRTRGWVELGRGGDWTAAERDFDAAVASLDSKGSLSDSGKALAERGVARVMLHRFDEAALDLGRARSELEIAGDRQTLGEMNNYLGQLEFVRQRVAESLDYFKAAADISAAFGTIDTLRYNLLAALHAEMRLLRWSDALATGERVHAIRERIGNPGMRVAADGYRAIVLAQVGRQRDAEALLDAVDRESNAIPTDLRRFGAQARAEIAWQRGRADLALAAAADALAVWPEDSTTDLDQRARMALLHQRASIALGRPAAADIAATSSDDALDAYRLVVAAEWAAAQDDNGRAERLFREASAAAEAKGVPDAIVLVADAEARWLLSHGRASEAAARAGRVAVWADQDFDSALLQVAAFHATGDTEAWSRALAHARAIAGERAIPAALANAPH